MQKPVELFQYTISDDAHHLSSAFPGDSLSQPGDASQRNRLGPIRTIGGPAVMRVVVRLAIALSTLLFGSLMLAAAREPAIPVSLKIWAAVLMLLAAVDGAWGLMVLAVLLPLAPFLQINMNAGIGFAETAELLTLSFLLPVAARAALRADVGYRPLGPPVFLMCSVVGVSAFVHVVSQFRQTAGATAVAIGRHLVGPYFVDTNSIRGLHAATAWIEAVTLGLLAAGVVAKRRSRQQRVAFWILLGGSAAAVFSVRRLIQISLARPHPFATALHFLATLRFHPFYADVNAAGSYLALFAVPVVWLAVRKPWWWVPAIVVTLALWMTGSRSAVAACVCGILSCWLMTRGARRRGIVIASAFALTIAGVVATHPAGEHSTAGLGARLRWELTRLGVGMALQHPLLGVGLDRFKPVSAAMMTPGFRERFPPLASGENAHNTFLQILGELGIAGLAAFVWLLVAPLADMRRTLRAPDTPDRFLVGLSGGLIAFLGSGLFGHPLLIKEILLAFFLALGVTAGVAAASRRSC